MPDISVSVGRSTVRREARSWTYRVAGRLLVCDAPIPGLQSFLIGNAGAQEWAPAGDNLGESNAHKLVYHGPGWIGNRWRDVECWSGEMACRLEIADAGHFLVSKDGQHIARIWSLPEASQQLLAECLLGPALVLALSLQRAWCMHASAVSTVEGVVLFVGDSGAGKSTLAHYLAGHPDEDLRLVSDDILVLDSHPLAIECLGHFPQLKLALDAQPVLTIPERLPLRAVYALAAPAQAIGVEPLARRDASLALARHTVGARLFPPDLLAHHLAFCVRLGTTVSTARLSYPHDLARLAEVRETVLSDLARAM